MQDDCSASPRVEMETTSDPVHSVDKQFVRVEGRAVTSEEVHDILLALTKRYGMHVLQPNTWRTVNSNSNLFEVKVEELSEESKAPPPDDALPPAAQLTGEEEHKVSQLTKKVMRQIGFDEET
eukprot:gene11138-13160_t